MSVYVPVARQRQIRAHFSECCAYCRTVEALTVATFEFEPIIPLSAGGQTTLENLCLACPSCNRHKAHRQSALHPLTNQSVARFHPRHQRWLEHFRWSEDGAAINGLTPNGQATVIALHMNRPPADPLALPLGQNGRTSTEICQKQRTEPHERCHRIPL